MTQKRAGAPTKYRPEFVQAFIDHFNVPAGTVERRRVNGVTMDVYVPVQLPLLQTFAMSIGVTSATVDDWVNATNEDGEPRYPEFKAAHAEAKRHQLRILTHNGLNSSYRTSFAIFAMKNMCGWRDAVSHEVTGVQGGALKLITKAMSPQEASEAYADTLREVGK